MTTDEDVDEQIREWMRTEIDKRGHGVKGDLARHLGMSSQDGVTRLISDDPKRRLKRLPVGILPKLEAFFGPSPLSRASKIPIMGYLGAGAEVDPDFEQVPPEGFGEVDLPFPLPDDMIAFKVRGISMMPVFKDGAVIVVYREQRRPLDTFYGEEAAVRTSEGKRYIKTINKGTKPGTVNLISWNDPLPIENQKLEWIGEIFTIMPPAAIRKAERQGGIQGQLRLKTA